MSKKSCIRSYLYRVFNPTKNTPFLKVCLSQLDDHFCDRKTYNNITDAQMVCNKNKFQRATLKSNINVT